MILFEYDIIVIGLFMADPTNFKKGIAIYMHVCYNPLVKENFVIRGVCYGKSIKCI